MNLQDFIQFMLVVILITLHRIDSHDRHRELLKEIQKLKEGK